MRTILKSLLLLAIICNFSTVFAAQKNDMIVLKDQLETGLFYQGYYTDAPNRTFNTLTIPEYFYIVGYKVEVLPFSNVGVVTFKTTNLDSTNKNLIEIKLPFSVSSSPYPGSAGYRAVATKAIIDTIDQDGAHVVLNLTVSFSMSLAGEVYYMPEVKLDFTKTAPNPDPTHIRDQILEQRTLEYIIDD